MAGFGVATEGNLDKTVPKRRAQNFVNKMNVMASRGDIDYLANNVPL